MNKEGWIGKGRRKNENLLRKTAGVGMKVGAIEINVLLPQIRGRGGALRHEQRREASMIVIVKAKILLMHLNSVRG